VAVRYVPMAQVAGDIYDFVSLDERRLCILVADVSGHGIPAALIASLVQGAFRAQREHMHEPHRVLSGMNRLLSGQFETEFVTAGCAFIDLNAGRLRYSGAGHPPMLLLPPEPAPLRSMHENGLMLGPFPQSEYASVEETLGGGERILLCTDGILEASKADGDFLGDEGLARLAERHREMDAERLAEHLIGEVDRWVGVSERRSHADDLTLIVVDVLELAAWT